MAISTLAIAEIGGTLRNERQWRGLLWTHEPGATRKGHDGGNDNR